MFYEDLKPVSFFSYLTEKNIRLIKSNCRELFFAKGAVILHQEEESFDLYIIVKGKVRVSLMDLDGREVVLDILEKGDFFGELSLLDNRSRSAMVTAMTDVKLMFIERDTFRRIVRENADIAINLLSVMASRLRRSTEMIETLTFLDVSGRVAKFLMETARENGEKMPHGFLKIKGPTHQMIANRIGASREAVTKAIKSLVSNGLISVNGKDVIISPKQFELL